MTATADSLDVRAEFPILRDGLVYLDTAATSQKPAVVLDTMDDFLRHHNASVHRGVYPLAAESTERYEVARATAAAWLGSTPDETVFTGNATGAINLVAYSWGDTNVREGDVIVVTEMEHHSNLVPWQLLAQRTGARLEYVHIDDDGRLLLDELDALLEQGPKLVAVTHVSNVVGTINPVEDIVRRARAAGAATLVDGSQAVPQIPVDVGAIGADFYVWTAHKVYGPTGIGLLHGRAEVLETMPPFFGGGHMIAHVGDLESTFAKPPVRFEAGTPPIVEAIGMGAAVEWLAAIGIERVRAHALELTAYALERLAEEPGLTIHGPREPDARGALVSFALDYAHPHDVAEIAGRRGVCVRAGHHCTQPLMRRLGVGATSRASFAAHTTREDVDALIDALHDVRELFA